MLQALRDPRWEYRTAAGIATELGIDQDQVEAILVARPDLARLVNLTDEHGRRVWAPAEKPRTFHERLGDLRSLLAREDRRQPISAS